MLLSHATQSQALRTQSSANNFLPAYSSINKRFYLKNSNYNIINNHKTNNIYNNNNNNYYDINNNYNVVNNYNNNNYNNNNYRI